MLYSNLMKSNSLYVHIPFCASRCPYCHFVTYAGMEELIPAYLRALAREIYWWGEYYEGSRLNSVYFGGGTPSILSVEQIEQLIQSIQTTFEIETDSEISLEVNPERKDLQYFSGLKTAGINRLSFGMQSASEKELVFLQRRHNLDDLVLAVENSREAGFDNISLDLIFGLPGQNVHSWAASLQKAVELEPEHISLYDLEISPGTVMHKWLERGAIRELSTDIRADMYEAAQKYLSDHGFEQYEISNWCRPGYQSRHNLGYWSGEKYVGVGTGAHGFNGRLRIANIGGVSEYINALSATEKNQAFPAAAQIDELSERERKQEFMFLGLRRIQTGVSERDFFQRFRTVLREDFTEECQKLIKLDLLIEFELNGERRLKLSQKGVLLANRVFQEFVD